MSYSFTVTTPRSSLRKSLDDALAAQLHEDPDVESERSEHVVAALGAVEDLAEVIGRPEDDLFVNVTGHANPDHAPRDGFSDEVITVSISARPAKEPASA